MLERRKDESQTHPEKKPIERLVDLKPLLDVHAINRIMQIFDIPRHSTQQWFQCPECSRIKLRTCDKNPINLVCQGCSITTNLFSLATGHRSDKTELNKEFALKKIIYGIQEVDAFQLLSAKFDFMLFKHNLNVKHTTGGPLYYIGNQYDEEKFNALAALRNIKMCNTNMKPPYIARIKTCHATRHPYIWCTTNRLLEIK
ncbi:hypothetical protein PULV_a3948 [Pseudoalteromonas ulvae UL12]|uniref:hypothetical protein n=1 Tax=Pseudoalteromonas ulvae TaxID=107327 RepID=UPI00186B828B|nr:hypothetical protein [Pseudoalteromonas ulvae]MBE0362143.1 hypothetical protein [Pseudoalteromonas ulvae UL12]